MGTDRQSGCLKKRSDNQIAFLYIGKVLNKLCIRRGNGLQESLDHLRSQISNFEDLPEISQTLVDHFIANCTVVLAVGGEGTRLSSLTKSKNINKSSLILPNGDALIERTVKMYRNSGLKRFVCLVYHEASSIVQLLGDGSSLGVEITYSYDPGKPVGRGGAILNAILNGYIPIGDNIIVHNPDDQIVDYNESFPKHIIKGHISGISKGMLATVVVVESISHPYTGMKINNSVIQDIEMYPTVPIPTHIGVTIFSPDIKEYFKRLFTLTEKVDFEATLFPELSESRVLYSVPIASNYWIPVNDPKSFKELVEKLAKDK